MMQMVWERGRNHVKTNFFNCCHFIFLPFQLISS
uniref:Uncharacterized protein n=1 Tax=Lepeophtheirus salmonis TaxID=72036 RepID=A0A0K2TY30_LEPSM